jgi:hypothetical protein
MKKKSLLSAQAPRESVVFSEFSEKNKVNHRLKTVVIVACVLFFLALFIAFAANRFFSIEEIVIDGVSRYSYDTILENANLQKGDLIFFTSQAKLESRLKQKLPYVRSVKVELELPTTVSIEIEEETPAYYFSLGNEYFLITREMKVLERFSDLSDLLSQNEDVMCITIPEVSQAIITQKVSFVSDYDSKHTDDILYELKDWDRFDSVTDIFLENRFDLVLVYENRITIRLGSYSDFQEKLTLVANMVDHYSEDATGIFLVDDVQKGVAQMD